jgi:hypothetical protein
MGENHARRTSAGSSVSQPGTVGEEEGGEEAEKVSENGKRSIDERLQDLVGRHEALTQSVELLSADVRALLEAQREHERWLVLLTKIVARHDERLDAGE